MHNEVQTSFHVFGNSLESTFVYDSNCFSNFCLQLISSQWSIPVYNVLCSSPEILVTGSRVWGARRSLSRSTLSNPSSRKLYVQIFSYFITIVRGCTVLLEDHALWIVSKLGKQKTQKYFFTYFLQHFRLLSKVRLSPCQTRHTINDRQL